MEMMVLMGKMVLMEQMEKMVLTLYYFDELTMREIGALIERSESRVCQLHSKTIGDMRERFDAMVSAVPPEMRERLRAG